MLVQITNDTWINPNLITCIKVNKNDRIIWISFVDGVEKIEYKDEKEINEIITKINIESVDKRLKEINETLTFLEVEVLG